MGFAVEVVTALSGERYHLGKRRLFDLSNVLRVGQAVRDQCVPSHPRARLARKRRQIRHRPRNLGYLEFAEGMGDK